MPRYYRRRYTRVVKPKKKWATNLVDLSPTIGTEDSAHKAVFTQQICVNSSATATPTPVIVKTGNFKLQFDASFGLQVGAPLQFAAYVVYVPEGTFSTAAPGYNECKNLIDRHPEWILLWKFGSFDFITSTAQGNIDSVRVSSRLKRNLNSGDSIWFIGLAITTQTIVSSGGHGMCQYWTCAN